MIRAIAIILMATPAWAETAALNPDGTAWVQVTETDGPHVYEVTFQNRLTGCAAWCQTEFSVVLDGLTIMMDYEGGANPDTMSVIPPPGFIAIPDHVTVDEDAQGVIRIYEGGLS